MGKLEAALMGVGAVEAALLLLLNWRAYRRRVLEWESTVWWEDGKHDEVEKYPRRLFGDRGEGGE